MGGPAPKPQDGGDAGPSNQTTSAASSPKPVPAAASNLNDQPRPKINVTPIPAAIKNGGNPFTQLGIHNRFSPASVSRERKRPSTEIDDGSVATPPARKQTPQQAPETDEDYEHRILSQIFRITVDPLVMTNHLNQRLTFLPNLNQDINDAGEPLRLNTSIMDQAIIESCSNFALDKPLMQYLLPCWKRAVKSVAPKAASQRRVHVHEEAKRLCMSNCLFALTMPDLYG